MKFQGKYNHCGKYGHKEFQCWAKYGRLIKTDDQVNQAVEDVKDEEVVLMAWSSRIEDDQGTDNNEDVEQKQEEAQEPEPPRPR